MPFADVIIPAFNNARELKPMLSTLFQQQVPAAWSMGVIISDDGSRDETVAQSNAAAPPVSWRRNVIITGPHGGPAAARNRGLEHSRAELILFLGADIVLRPGALAAHLNFHAAYADVQHAALGMIKWDPRLNPSPFMEWMTHGGGQNDFDSLLGRRTADARHFLYGSHLSLKRAAFGKHRFPETYRGYGWEDLDLGRTLAPRLTLHILPEAVALHRHFYTTLDIGRRQYLVGRGLTTYQQRYPRSPLVPKRPKLHRLKVRLITLCGGVWFLRYLLSYTSRYWSTPRLFTAFTALNWWRGVYDTLRPQPPRA